jgi:hypothetical protein
MRSHYSDMQLQGRTILPEKTTGHGFRRAPFAASLSLPSRLGRSGIARARSAPPSTTRCFSAFSSRDARFFTGEFVRGSFLVRRASTFRRDRALCLRVHCRKSAGSFADVAGTARFSCAVTAAAHSTAANSTASASLVHSFVLVVAVICHYRSPAAIFEFNDACRWTYTGFRWAGRAKQSSAGYFDAQASGRKFEGRWKPR